MANYPELRGKVAVITGAGRHNGLGEAMAMRLAEEGCKVLITDIGEAKGKHCPESAIGTHAEMKSKPKDFLDRFFHGEPVNA